MHSILGWASFCMNYCINAAWHGGNQPAALLRCNEAQVALKLSQVFESALLDGILKLAVIPVACAYFSLSCQLLNLTCFDTALLEQPPLSVMTLCDLPSLWGVSMIVFWTIANSTVFPTIVVSKNQEIHNIYTVWMVIY